MLSDCSELRQFLKQIYPSFQISTVAKASGQRVVYFGRFTHRDDTEPEGCDFWGEVVVKISEATSRASISYMQKEIEVLKTVESEHFPKLFFDDVITFDPFTEEPLNPLRMISIEEKVNSKVLSEVMSDFNTEVKVVNFLIEIISALRILWEHPQRLIHRDLKPDNILIRNDGIIVIIDLGILRQEGISGNTHTFLSYGPCTPCYASPEQAVNDKMNISFKTDIFSLGLICYEMLSGSNPFLLDGEPNYVDDILERVCSYEPKKLCELGISVNISIIISKMMSKEPYKRYRTVERLIDDLSEVIKCL
jgi:serine/threonine-protein kinase